jgi:branched-chain amino acid transport system substrate-binding protein
LVTKRTLRVVSILAVLVVLGAACSKKNNSSSGGGGTSGANKTAVKIAYMGALTGDAAQLVVPGYQAAELAVEQANAGKFGDLPVTITLVKEDTQGSPDQAPGVADKIVNDPAFVGVIGPAFSGESNAAGAKLDQAGIPFITPSATNPTVAQNNWTHWFRAVGNDNSQGPAAAKYIQQKLSPSCVVVSSDDSTYGAGLADIVNQTLDAAKIKTNQQISAVTTGQKDFSALVTKIKDSTCNVLFYGGYSPEAAPLRQQMTQAGLTNVTMVGGDGIKDDSFTSGAAAAGEGTVAACPCADVSTSTDPKATAFNSAYKAKWGAPPGIYSAEAWDISQIFIAAFKAGKITRSDITAFVKGLNNFPGLTKNYTFQANGELDDKSVSIYFYQDKSSAWAFLGRSDQILTG